MTYARFFRLWPAVRLVGIFLAALALMGLPLYPPAASASRPTPEPTASSAPTADPAPQAPSVDEILARHYQE